MESQYCYGWEKGKKKDKIEVKRVEKVNVSKNVVAVCRQQSSSQYFSISADFLDNL